ncbi:hypothetical protein J1605_015134 [Eschrichtius robustus]|uniref:Uncharacterized protein n=1 Tax=Eschrichtius robustus TaxID=9764 RepID=A0AB34GBF4_ESCRO|nr:hypothetical protein J1605_015134 [Eschrichtius robustus]
MHSGTAAVAGSPSEAEGEVDQRSQGSSQTHGRHGHKAGPSTQQVPPDVRAPVQQKKAQEKLSFRHTPRAVTTRPERPLKKPQGAS